MFIFNSNVVFTLHFLKMAPIRVSFSLGFLSGGGFHREEFAPAWFKSPLEHLKMNKKCSLGNFAPKSIRRREVKLLLRGSNFRWST
jgi:hypothetical protein